MNAHRLIEYMDSLMNEKEDIQSNFGKHFVIVLIDYQLQH
jgi:hypothetical protein